MIPQVKKFNEFPLNVDLSKIHWIFDEDIDFRIKNLCQNISKDSMNGFNVHIYIRNYDETESYKIEIFSDSAVITSESVKGAFYALQTFKQLRIIYKNNVPECLIEDEPDLKVRGFYLDISRGRVPKLEKLKKIVDQLAYFKINMLQLYVENTFDFREYDEITNKENLLTKEEIKELDEYCNNNFIELVPSLSTFGHLYDLLQSEKYKHLCEYENYEPKEHYWIEKMMHHTIDVSNEESINLIYSMIDQYIPLFRSDKFNICCDETFDLCKGKNKGLDASEEYFKFVNKIITYLESKNKKVQMWADIVLNHNEKFDLLNKHVTLLNWQYEADVIEERIKIISDNNINQILCPAIWSWMGFIPRVNTAVANITNMSFLAKKYNSLGILNTAWGDYGHVCSWAGHIYGMIVGAEKSWNASKDIPDDKFDIEATLLGYGINNFNVPEIFKKLSLNDDFIWTKLVKAYSSKINNQINFEKIDTELLIKVINDCNNAIERLDEYKNESLTDEIVTLIEGLKLSSIFLLKLLDGEYDDKFDFDDWLRRYEKIWLIDNKKSELLRIVDFFESLKYLHNKEN